jgi:SnoaL-like domain
MTDTEVEDLTTELPAVWRLLGSYARLWDGKDPAAWSRLFAENGTLQVLDHTVTGRADLEQFAQRSGKGVHVQGVPVVERHDGGLRVTSNYVYVEAATKHVTAGEYRDELREVDGQLLFSRRVIDLRVRD